MKTHKFLVFAFVLGFFLAGCASTESSGPVKRRTITFQIDRIVWPYPVLRDVPIHPGDNFTEKRIGAVSLIVLKNVEADSLAPIPSGYCIALGSDLPPEKLGIVAGESYEAEIFENFVSSMYVPVKPEKPWDKLITDLKEVVSLKKK